MYLFIEVTAVAQSAEDFTGHEQLFSRGKKAFFKVPFLKRYLFSHGSRTIEISFFQKGGFSLFSHIFVIVQGNRSRVTHWKYSKPTNILSVHMHKFIRNKEKQEKSKLLIHEGYDETFLLSFIYTARRAIVFTKKNFN